LYLVGTGHTKNRKLLRSHDFMIWGLVTMRALVFIAPGVGTLLPR